MDKNFSEEIIEIDGKEYKLFINRIGIVNWEKMTKAQRMGKALEEKYSNFDSEEEIIINDDTNPFESNIDIDEDEKIIFDIYSKFYWMALYTNHKLKLSEAEELFKKALVDYGYEQLIDLALQMLEEANTDSNKGELKNLKALKSAK